MTDEQANRLEKKLDKIIDALPALDFLGQLVVQHGDATKRIGLNKNTITNNENIAKYGIPGSNVTLLKLTDLTVIKKRKRAKSPVKPTVR